MSSENPIQEFSLRYNQLVRLEFAKTECAKVGTVAKLGLNVLPPEVCQITSDFTAFPRAN